MKTNKTLQLAEIFFKILTGITSLTLLGIIIIFIHSSFSPETYDKLTVNNGRNLIYKSDTTPSAAINKESNDKEIKLIYFNKLIASSKLFLLFNITLTTTFFLLILRKLTNFIKSVKDYNSFHRKNSKYFTMIGKYFSYLLFLQILTTYIPLTIKYSEDNYHSFLNFNLTPFIFYAAGILLCFTIGQVFKEGERLKIESELTI